MNPGSTFLRTLALSGLVLNACADRNVGQPVPADQLYYPTGMQLYGAEGAQQLAILSSNFDQRFQSQQVSVFDVEVLLDGVLGALGTPDGNGACAAAANQGVVYTDGFVFGARNAILGRARLPGVGGELLAVPDGGGGHWLYTTSRLNSALIMVYADASGTLGCSNAQEVDPEDGEPLLIRNTDCSRRFLTSTQAEDPYSLTRGMGPQGPYIAVGHLFAYIDGLSNFGAVTVFDESKLIAQATSTEPIGAEELEGVTLANIVSTTPTTAPESPYIDGFGVPSAAGIGGVAYAPAHPGQALLVLTLRFRPQLSLTALEFRRAGQSSTREPGSFVPVTTDALRLDALTNAIESRGMALTDDGRAVLSLRFSEPGVISNAGAFIARIDGPQMSLFPGLELGSELGPPALRPRRTPNGELLAYFGDLLADKIWVVDITQDVPRPAGEILGRAPRTAQGRTFFGRTLDAPTQIEFATRGDRTYAFVGNFANSTLAVLDVSEGLPAQQHCLLGRLGRDVDANGESELQSL